MKFQPCVNNALLLRASERSVTIFKHRLNSDTEKNKRVIFTLQD